jgi:regulator of nucleoside diphosphate kinase
MEVTNDERTLTELDYVRLEKLIREHEHGPDHSAVLAALEAAQCVPSPHIEPDIVTMGSRALLMNLHSGETYTLTLCYPPEARPSAGFISVLSPVGASLIGRRIGEIARWRTPDGGDGTAQVMALLFQPEASGLYTL